MKHSLTLLALLTKDLSGLIISAMVEPERNPGFPLLPWEIFIDTVERSRRFLWLAIAREGLDAGLPRINFYVLEVSRGGVTKENNDISGSFSVLALAVREKALLNLFWLDKRRINGIEEARESIEIGNQSPAQVGETIMWEKTLRTQD